MRHYTSSDFWTLYWSLPPAIRKLADKNYELLKENPWHPSLQLKRIDELWSVRVGRQYCAIGIDAPDGIQWIWIGSHADYDQIIAWWIPPCACLRPRQHTEGLLHWLRAGQPTPTGQN